MTKSDGAPASWPTRADVLALAVPFIAEFEGFRGSPYLCPAGVATIGYGTTQYPDGRKVRLADEAITKIKARDYLESDSARKLDHLWRKDILVRVPTVHQAAAMLSLVYNIGFGAFIESTLLRLFDDDDVAGAADQFPRWSKGHVDGRVVVLDGLTRRRAAERALFLTPD